MQILEALRALYIKRNNEGLGYHPYSNEGPPYGATLEEILAEFVAGGAEIMHRAESSSDISIVRHPDGDLLGIGDSQGLWAVVLVP
jgi:hypothetical protein